MSIDPECSSVSLKRAAKRELFPAPVLPTTPIFSVGLVSNVIPLSAEDKWFLRKILSLKNVFNFH